MTHTSTKKFEADEQTIRDIVTEVGRDKFIEKLYHLLSKHKCSIKFKKANGDIRVMECTRNNKVHPAAVQFIPEQEERFDFSSDAIRVIDVESGKWRSFKVNSLIYLSYEKDGSPENEKGSSPK